MTEEIEIEGFKGEEALWRLATALSAALTPSEVAEALANEGGIAASGTFANMALRLGESDQVQIVHRSLVETDGTRSRMFDLEEKVPACEAIRGGLPVLLGSADEIQRRFPDVWPDALAAGLEARASLPLHGGSGDTLGAIGFGWAEPQEFDAPQLRRLDLIAQLTGLALERARRGTSDHVGDAELGLALETMPNAYFSIDTDFRITHVNAEGARLLRASSEDLKDKRLIEAFPEAAGSAFEVEYRRAMESGRSTVFEEYYAALDSWFEVHAWPSPHGLNVYFADISARHNAEHQRSTDLEDAMVANNRLRLLTDVAARAADADSCTEVFERITHVLVPGMADWCTIVVPGEDALVRVAARHADPSLDALAKRLVGSYPHAYSGPSPGVVAYRSGEPLLMGHLAREIAAGLDDSLASAAYGRTLELLGDGPGLLTPVKTGDQVDAVITMTRSSGEPFSEQDVSLMAEVATLVSVALIAAEHQQVQHETARALQAAALPSSLPSSDHLRLAACYQAASGTSDVGGDWYDAFELENGRIALVVGDVAGHGLSAAALTAQMRNALRAHLFAGMRPLESLMSLSRLIALQEPDALATIICVEIDPVSGDVMWASAGHPAPIVVSAAGTSAHLRGRPIPPIGIGGSHLQAEEFRASVHARDRMPLDPLHRRPL